MPKGITFPRSRVSIRQIAVNCDGKHIFGLADDSCIYYWTNKGWRLLK